jgi:hypothetical protein
MEDGQQPGQIGIKARESWKVVQWAIKCFKDQHSKKWREIVQWLIEVPFNNKVLDRRRKITMVD